MSLREKGIDFIKQLDSYAGLNRKFLVKYDEDTDPSYGCLPTQRPIEEYIKLGVINLDKPPGPTSHEVVAWVKRLLGLSKAGHGGTLEPPTP